MSGAEGMLLVAGSGCYVVGAGYAWRQRWRSVGQWILLGALVFAAAIAVRWVALGQGPFLTMFEILVSKDGSWSLLVSLAGGSSCVVASGQNWQRLPQDKAKPVSAATALGQRVP